jgi:hypothetical protein
MLLHRRQTQSITKNMAIWKVTDDEDSDYRGHLSGDDDDDDDFVD